MPAGVVVVKRARRRAFALLWAVPALLRSVWTGLRGDARTGLEAPDALAFEGVAMPALARDAAGEHACTACRDCVAICPSDCLFIVDRDGAPTVFELAAGACISCGRCIEVCPEAALVPARAAAVIATTSLGAVPPRDLLADITNPTNGAAEAWAP